MAGTLAVKPALYPTSGADLSSWQGKVDFQKLKSKISFVYIRAGVSSTYRDPACDAFREGCRRVDLPFGLYWGLSPGKDITKHARSFYSVWDADPGRLPPAFDFELTNSLPRTKLQRWLHGVYSAFGELAQLELQGMATYTSPGFLNRYLPTTSWLKYTQLWVAHWTPDALPLIPEEWRKNGFTWRFWQFSNMGVGEDYGVSSRFIDLDRFNGTLTELVNGSVE